MGIILRSGAQKRSWRRWKFSALSSVTLVCHTRFSGRSLPSGFIKETDFGLGLIKDLRFIPIVIEAVPDVTRLIVSKRRKTEVSGSDVIIAWRDFDDLRKAFNRIHTKAVISLYVLERVPFLADPGPT